MKKNICVFCASSENIDANYKITAKNLAEKLVKSKKNLIFGGANVGMMRIMAETIHARNGRMTAVIPELIKNAGLACPLVADMRVTPDMNSRKAKLAQLADAFIALPGGFGTLEELSEVITAKHLGYHNKPIVILNINHFYDNLIAFFNHLYKENFAKISYKNIYYISDTIEDTCRYIENYKAENTQAKY